MRLLVSQSQRCSEILAQLSHLPEEVDPATPFERLPLSALVDVNPNKVGPLQVNHQGQFPSVTLGFNLRPGVSLGTAIDKVNDTDNKASALSEAYDRGEEVPLTEVVLSMQKASLAFEATLQVRNKVMKAYEEILNMPV